MINKTLEQLKVHEGFEHRVYHCTEGKETIGFGFNISANPLALPEYELQSFRQLGITYNRAEQLLKAVVTKNTTELYKRLPWITQLNEARQAVIINMAFQMGVKGLLNFKRTLAFIEHGSYDNAAIAMSHSKWAEQTPNRVKELSEQMKTGEFPEYINKMEKKSV